MGRLKGGKQLRGVPQSQAKLAAQSKAPPSSTKLLAKAQELVAQCNFELARKFLERILQNEPNNSDARELFGVVLLEEGEVDAARQVCAPAPLPALYPQPLTLCFAIHQSQ